MASRPGIGAVVSGVGLAGLGAASLAAWQTGLWGTMAGALLATGWMLALGWWAAVRPRGVPVQQCNRSEADEGMPLQLLLDQLPVPLLKLEGGGVHALNRAARGLFATDDRVLPAPSAMMDTAISHLFHEGRRWRIDRVEARGAGLSRTIVALIDVEAEERTAEARAAAEMIQVLGHELLNGLAPIVSLAESGLAALDVPAQRDALLPEILGTLARRTEGLLRFTDAYRTLARLPTPVRAPVRTQTMADDLARLFAGRWADMAMLDVLVEEGPDVPLDRDQITQAVWALLQNGAEAAILAGDRPSVHLEMRYDSGQFLILIRDSGDGVSPSEASRIFRPFHTTKATGSGVGLSLARQIAHAHGGELTLLSFQPATFRLTLPILSRAHLEG